MGDLAEKFVAESRAVIAKPTIAKLNHSHEAIARWLLENPDRTMGQCADHFGYTASWLSIIIHSDAFQHHYRALQGKADEFVVADIPAKMRGVASMALDALAVQVEAAAQDRTVQPRAFLLQTSEALLSKLGYGAKPTQVNVNTGGGAAAVAVGVVQPEALERARARLTQQRSNEAKVVEGEVVGKPAA